MTVILILLLKKKKFKLLIIKNKKKKNKLIQDSNHTKNICKKLNITTLIVDHYYLGFVWEKEIKKNIKNLVVIDDFSKNKHCCDLIINNLKNQSYNKTTHLTGLKYVIVPGTFLKKRNNKKNKKLTIGTFFGSTDKANCSEKLLRIFTNKEFIRFKCISILGKNNKNKEKIYKNFVNYKNINIEKNFIKMGNFFEKIDILITVGGMTSFEALLNNVKCIYVPINYYQKTTCAFLKKNKISSIIPYNKIFTKRGKQLLLDCIIKISKEKKSLIKKISFDNLGSQRVASYIAGSKIN